MHSLRSSMQSMSTKRSSEQSDQSSKSASMQSTEFTTMKSDSTMSPATMTTCGVNVFDHSSTSSFTAVTAQQRTMACISSSNISTCSDSSSSLLNSSVSQSNLVRTSDVQLQMKCDVIEPTIGCDVVTDEEPPALPVKTRQRSTRRERHNSHYDNVEETDNFSR